MAPNMTDKIRIAAIVLVPMIILGAMVVVPSLLTQDPFDTPRLPFAPLRKLLPHTGPPYPSEILDLTNWKVTLPVGNPGRKSKQPLEIRQPELAAYRLDPWFMPLPDTRGVVFRAPVNAPTTGDTDYPRSELREMTNGGRENAVWSSKKGTHTLILDQAITAVPKGKPHIVAGQVHGDDDDVLVIRLEYPTLYIARSKKNVYTLDDRYVLGERFTVKFVAHDGKILVYYDGSDAPVYTLDKKLNEAYFKAGAYTQSNCETENSPDLCTADNYGEVVIYQATVTHE